MEIKSCTVLSPHVQHSALYPLSHRHPSMETPLDVLSRAASFVHANEEEGKFDHTTRFLLCVMQ